jgi:AhpD family alkylhydroperoxidase
VARLPATQGAAEIAAQIRERRGGALRPIDGMLLHSPQLADGWNRLLGAIRDRSGLPGAVRELVTMRVAALNKAEYEWVAHEASARREGLSPDVLDALRGPDASTSGALTASQRNVVAYTDAMTIQVRVPDEVFDALRTEFTDPELVELTATVAAYNMVSRFVVALDVTG